MVTEISREVAADEFAVIFAQGGLDWRQSKRRIAKAIQARGHDAKRSKTVEATGEIYGDSGARLPVLEARSSHEAQIAAFEESLNELLPTPLGQEFFADLVKIYPPEEARERAVNMMLERDLPKVFAKLESELSRFSQLPPAPPPDKYSNGRRKDGIEVDSHKHRGRLPKDEILRAHLAINSFEEGKRSEIDQARHAAYRIKDEAGHVKMLAEVQRLEENLNAELDFRRRPLVLAEIKRLAAKKFALAFDPVPHAIRPSLPSRDKDKHARRKKRSQRQKASSRSINR